ncbi:TIGR02647 family protein [Pseudoalteromonas sp. NBT06-2]|uniref:TIGR02647 family protein n=1 Tax=Pseudoalteromonas sp. NBT06-2 TaxID=2025950 RepID=UPI000BA7D390|nr:TIGR02647 family protein [Pseudoalteromonas sp. NBT06-2]PAJ76156.1 TIGR02647 family protein [Pseudoalteromonas sp. NBT06-2]
MQFSQHMCEELDLILKFPMDSMMQGLKVHQDAEPALVEAAKRLFEKGIIDQKDGGYLTDLGLELAEHAQTLQSALKS